MIEQSEVNSILGQFLEAHGLDTTAENEWFVPNGALPAIRAVWHEPPEQLSGRLDIHVLLERDMIIEESFAGIGQGMNGLKDGFQNFSINSLHVLLAAFWDIHEPDQLFIEEWLIDDTPYTAYIGNFGTRGSRGGHPGIPEETFPRIEKTLKETPLTQDYHWVRTFFCNINSDDRIYEALLNNEVWPAGENALKAVNWVDSDNYYSVRNFLILKKKQA